MVRMAQVYAEMAKPAGIDINVIVTPAESYLGRCLAEAVGRDLRLVDASAGEGLAVAYTQSAKWKETHWERPDYDAMLLKANTTVDTAERLKLFQQTGELLAKEGGLVASDVRPPGLALRKGCEGYTPLAQNFNLNFEDLSCSK